jgi:Fe-S cluster assembly protein SufB
MEHEASTSKIGEDQLFYLRQRGLKAEDAVSMIVNGFCKRVFRELPMEFAVEAQKLLGVTSDGTVGPLGFAKLGMAGLWLNVNITLLIRPY